MKKITTFISAITLVTASLANEGVELISKDALSHFKPVKGWHMVENVSVGTGQKKITSVKGDSGIILLNGEVKEKIPYLFTAETYGDVSLSLEFMISKGSNAGIFFMGLYEVQILDSYGRDSTSFRDLGGIYQRWNPLAEKEKRGFEGTAPKINAAKAPGEWQRIDVVFRAPRFDSSGKKLENARFESVHVNGVLVQKNVSVTGPTRGPARGHWLEGEVETGPVAIQGDHGPIAIRSFVVKPLEEKPEQQLSQVEYLRTSSVEACFISESMKRRYWIVLAYPEKSMKRADFTKSKNPIRTRQILQGFGRPTTSRSSHRSSMLTESKSKTSGYRFG